VTAFSRRQTGPIPLGTPRIIRAATLRTAAYYAWVTLPAPWTATRFTLAARRHGVVVMPAEAVHVASGAPLEAVRIALGVETRQQIERGLDCLAELLDRPKRPMAPIV
jgi:DNA-binding transcriptional MocR family regulator